jgi:hypothetical protein
VTPSPSTGAPGDVDVLIDQIVGTIPGGRPPDIIERTDGVPLFVKR